MPKTILLVDSDAALRSQLARALTGNGYKVSENDGREVVEQLRAHPPAAVVLCVELPKGSGYAICSKVRKDEALKHVKVILTSSEATQKSFDDHKKLRNGRADEYMLKPFSGDDLVEKLTELVGPGFDNNDEALGLSDLANEFGDDKGEEKVTLEDVEEISVEDDVAVSSSSLPGEADVDMLENAFDRLESDKGSHRPLNGGGHEDDDEVSHEMPTRIGPVPTRSSFNEPPRAAHEADEALDHLEQPDEALGHDEVVHPEVEMSGGEEDEPLAPPIAAPPPEDEPLDVRPKIEAPSRAAAAVSAAAVSTGSSGITGGSRDKEYFQLKERLAQREKDLLRLREELTAKEKELLEQRDHETAVEREVSAKDEDLQKRDAQIKQLQQKVDALVAGQRRTERDLTASREEARTATTKAEAATSAQEQAEAEGNSQRERADHLDEELRTAQNRVSELEGETEHQRSRNDEIEAELTGVRAQLDDANANIEDLRQQLDQQRQENDSAQEELRHQIITLEDEKQKNEERLVKAFQRLKSEEKLREKAKKALTIAQQLLDEPVGSDDEEAESEEQLG